ncbi:TetR/AcrR family transcriptional regulator [Aeromonas hydrophila]|uniref:TetR/AcrR family transcriptional regulator n=1 Tax=Aeromonas hydrophila TaxID=644 RepID=UPI0022AEAB27|nr:TetR/AcrR family transcriptional regulator [Aeromonas hydrophila]ELB2789515.1 TetR/AcrR family transcriptional regulator [Aeromonas hydrophila]MCZ4331592.1 TetR/AcrR family transcriptional regulator [Aeromonas hydrophila]
MDCKPKRRTRDRILATALAQFNLLGEPTVTTSAIAAELEMSQGNLYYHFHNKEEIVNALFGEFEQEMAHLLDTITPPLNEAEDIWFFLHLMFELIWKYRFFYYDISTLMSGNHKVELRFSALLRRKEQTAAAICHSLWRSGLLQGDETQVTALAANIALVGTFWISYQRALYPRADADIALGVFQVMQLVAPRLRADARADLDAIATHYQPATTAS